MQYNIAIVVAAYNRPASLQRLLNSIESAHYNGYSNIPLIVSIDFSGNDTCKEIADRFEWKYGTKTTVCHPQNLGLKQHILKCGDYAIEYDAVIVLEDDLFVTSTFYDFCQQAYTFYKDEEAVAGVGLYNYRYNEFAHCPFEPITDGYSNYFLQIPCSSGQMWTSKMWEAFKTYLSTEDNTIENLAMPEAVVHWPLITSWKRSFFKYIVMTDKYFVYPRIALATNFGDPGSHFNNPEYVWQTPLLVGRMKFTFCKIDQSFSIYDSFFELHSLAYERITGKRLSVTFDLNGTKPLNIIKTEYLISSKQCNKPIITYSSSLYPYESNIFFEVANENNTILNFSFAQTAAFKNFVPLNRIVVDIKRILPHMDHLMQVAKEEVFQTIPYKIGKKIIEFIKLPKLIINKFKFLFKK